MENYYFHFFHSLQVLFAVVVADFEARLWESREYFLVIFFCSSFNCRLNELEMKCFHFMTQSFQIYYCKKKSYLTARDDDGFSQKLINMLLAFSFSFQSAQLKFSSWTSWNFFTLKWLTLYFFMTSLPVFFGCQEAVKISSLMANFYWSPRDVKGKWRKYPWNEINNWQRQVSESIQNDDNKLLTLSSARVDFIGIQASSKVSKVQLPSTAHLRYIFSPHTFIGIWKPSCHQQ